MEQNTKEKIENIIKENEILLFMKGTPVNAFRSWAMRCNVPCNSPKDERMPGESNCRSWDRRGWSDMVCAI